MHPANTPAPALRPRGATPPRLTARHAALLASLLLLPAHAQWVSLNPGGGGQIQSIVLDPNTPGRAYHLSDMEGIYRTDDHGDTYQFIGIETISSNCIGLAIEPGNANRVYLGTIHGLQISDNAGVNWGPRIATVTPDTSTMVGEPIQAITVDPSNVNRVFAGPGGTFRWATNSPQPTLNGNYIVSGEPSIYRSTDRGANWSEITLATGVNIRREVFNIAVHPTNSNIVYAANRGGGVYRSTNGGSTWTALARPSAAIAGSAPGGTGQCWGLALSPDGNILYATYTVGTNASLSPSDGTNLFVTPTAAINWTRLDGTGFPTTLYPFWKPVVDPRSTATAHKVLVSQCSGARIGLYEVTVDWNAGQTAVTSHSWELVGDKVNNPLFNYPGTQAYDPGWENYLARALYYSYTPVSWGYRGIWTTQDQTSYWVDTSWPDWQNDWRLLYCTLEGSTNGIRTYRNRGFHSTFNWDIASDGSYMLTGNADNATVESYDSGVSWTIQGSVGGNRTNAVAVALTSPRVALTHRGTGFGAGSTNGALYAKRLSTGLPWNGSTGDQWWLIAGGASSVAGVGNYKVSTITPDPFTTQRIYFVITSTDTAQQGVWVLNDVNASINAVAAGQNPPNATRILAANIGEGGDRKVQHDPFLAGVIWVNHSGGLHRGTRQTNGTYTWTTVVSTGVNGFAVWGYNGSTYVARYFNNGDLLLSADAGANWSTVLTSAQAVGPAGLVNPVWYQRQGGNVQDIRGLTGSGNSIFCAYAVWGAPRRHAGVFRGTIGSGTNVTWTDWTANIDFGYFSRAIVADVNGQPWFVGATQGAGVLGRPLTTYSLTTSATNGVVARSPDATAYLPGTVVQLTAVPNGGYDFTGWSGDLTGSANPANITMNGNRTVTASFNLAQPAHIAEPFAYANGANLQGQGSSTGNWTSSWSLASGTASATVTSPGFTYTGLATSGNRVVKSVTGSTANLIYSRTFGNASSLFQSGDTVWFSALVRKTNTTGGIFVLFNNGANQGQGFGFHLASGTVAPRVSGVNGGTLSVPVNTTALVVGRLTVNGGGTESLTIWVNPDLADPPTSGGVTLSTQNYDTVPTTLRLVTDNQNSTYELDEIRLGETFYSVLPLQ